jgi:hypothetical protein
VTEMWRVKEARSGATESGIDYLRRVAELVLRMIPLTSATDKLTPGRKLEGGFLPFVS